MQECSEMSGTWCTDTQDVPLYLREIGITTAAFQMKSKIF